MATNEHLVVPLAQLMSRLRARHGPQYAARLRMWASPRWDCQSAITSVVDHLHQQACTPGAPTPPSRHRRRPQMRRPGGDEMARVNRARDTLHDVPCPRARRPT
ncbi:hypothetical protein C8Q70DRAFT_273936 [Cubamyces menziesii]|nr:hypothetical protein C8Q70DRAFT_273936 [Cubamyces menziesii]